MKNFLIPAAFVVMVIGYVCLYVYCGGSQKDDVQIVAADTLTEEEALLSSLINSEAHNQDIRDYYLVGSTVLNRVDNKLFPNTVWGVIYQKSQYHGVGGNFTRSALSDTVAIRLMVGLGRNYDVLYFYNNNASDMVFKNLMKRHKLITITNNHNFFGINKNKI